MVHEKLIRKWDHPSDTKIYDIDGFLFSHGLIYKENCQVNQINDK